MRMIKYVLVLILIVVLAAIAVLPWVDGYYVQKTYFNTMAQIQKNLASQGFKLEITSYRLGWLSSDVKLHFTKPGELHPNVGFQVSQHINHGPLIHDTTLGWVFLAAKIYTLVDNDPEFASILQGMRIDKLQLTVDTLVFFDKKIVNHFMVAPINLDITATGKKISWQGLNATVDVPNLLNYTVNATIKPYTMKMHDGADDLHLDSAALNTNVQCHNGDCKKITIISSPKISFFHTVNNSGVVAQNISTQINTECNSGVCSRSMALTTPNLELMTGDKKLYLTNFGFTFTIDSAKKGEINAKTKLSFNQFTMNNLVFGPFSIDFEISNLNLLAMANLAKSFSLVSSVPANQTLSYQDFCFAVLKAGGYHIITPDLNVSENMQLITSYGNFNSSGRIFWPTNLPLPVNADDFVHNINVELDARVSDQFVDGAIQKLAEGADAITAAKKAQEAAHPAVQNDVAKDIDDFKKQLQVYVTQQQLSSNAFSAIVAALNSNMAPVLFELSLQQGLKNKQLTLAVGAYVRMEYAKIAGERLAELKIMFGTPVTDEEDLENRINLLVTKTYLTDATAKQIIQMQSQNLDQPIYVAFIKNLMAAGTVSDDVGVQLIRSYSALKGGDSATASSGGGTAEGLKKYFDTFVTKNYLVHDASGYSVSVVFNHGVLKLNGVDFQLPNQAKKPINPGMPMPASTKILPMLPGAQSSPATPSIKGTMVPQQSMPPATKGAPLTSSVTKPQQSNIKVAPTQSFATLPVTTQALSVPGP